MHEMTEQQTTRAPIEDVLLFKVQQLTETAYEHFTQGDIDKEQLKDLYGAVSIWSRASERVLETMQKLGIRT